MKANQYEMGIYISKKRGQIMVDIVDQNGNSLPQPPPLWQPVTSINIPQDGSGMKITVMSAPGFESSFTIGPDLMHQICKQWLTTCKNLQDQLRVIEHIKSTKVN